MDNTDNYKINNLYYTFLVQSWDSEFVGTKKLLVLTDKCIELKSKIEECDIIVVSEKFMKESNEYINLLKKQCVENGVKFLDMSEIYKFSVFGDRLIILPEKFITWETKDINNTWRGSNYELAIVTKGSLNKNSETLQFIKNILHWSILYI